MNYFFVTGSSKGLGKALTELLLASNNFVYGFARTSNIQHKNYVHTSLDFNDLNKVKEYKFPRLEIVDKVVLVNNAGMIGDIKRIGKINSESIPNTYNINLISPTILMNSFIDAYRTVETEKLILNISSGAGRSPIDGWSIYCSSKAGLDMFSQVLKEEIRIDGGNIEILSLSPGLIDSDMQQEIRNSSDKEFSKCTAFCRF